MTAEFGVDASRMDGCRTDAAPAMPLVEGHREENVGCLGPAVRNKRIVGRSLEVGVVEVHIGETMPGLREIDQASASGNQRGNAIDQYKMAEVVGAELRLKTVHSVPEWSRLDSPKAKGNFEFRAKPG